MQKLQETELANYQKNGVCGFKLKFIDLFCGAGFFSLGVKHAGFEHLFGVDDWKLACETYEANVGKAICIDIFDFDGKQYAEKVDIIIGSPPCQTFSSANISSRKCDMTLTNEFFRIIREVKPKIWIMENVPNVYPLIKAPFKTIFEMSDYGLLQNRKRCFASNIELHPTKEQHKYLSMVQTEKLLKFREKAVHDLFQTVNCRYNSFTKISPHIRDKKGIHVLSHLEAMQIQTVPFYFKLPNATQREIEKLIGNAVPPLFAYKLAQSILHTKTYQTELAS